MSILAQKLEDEGVADKAAEVLYKLSRLAGWLEPDSQVNVFGDLNAKDFEKIRKTLEEGKKGSQLNITVPSVN